MRIAQFLPSIQSQASGPSYSVPSLCDGVQQLQQDIELFVTLSGDTRLSIPVHTFPAIQFVPTMCISPSMKRELAKRKSDFDVVHTHGLWTMTSAYPHYLKGSGKKPIVVNAPRGQMSTWAMERSKWKKRLMWHVFQKRALEQVDCFHATAEKERKEIRALGYKQPIAIIPNGVDIPDLVPTDTEAKTKRKLMFLGRIHPVKGIDILLRSWQEIQLDFEDWELEICGPGEPDFVSEMKSLAQDLSVKNVAFTDGAFGDEKHARFQSADLYVLPSHTENYGLTVAESLSNGTPVIATSGTPWTTLANQDCGWTIDLSQENLTNCLRESMALDEAKLSQMGMNGRRWMESDFSWNEIARKMVCVYQWLLGEAYRPDWVDVV